MLWKSPAVKTKGVRVALLSASIVSLLFAVQGCASLPVKVTGNVNTIQGKKQTNHFQGTPVKVSSAPKINQSAGNPLKRVADAPFQTNVTGQNSKNVATIRIYRDGSSARTLGYVVFAVYDNNHVLEVEFSSNSSVKSQLLKDSYSIAQDLSFSIALHQPFIGINTIDIAGFVNGKRLLDYFIPGAVMNEWGTDTVSSQYVQSRVWTKVD